MVVSVGAQQANRERTTLMRVHTAGLLVVLSDPTQGAKSLGQIWSCGRRVQGSSRGEVGLATCDLDRLDAVPGNLLGAVADVVLYEKAERFGAAIHDPPSYRAAVSFLDRDEKVSASFGGLHIR
jgi:hypothetical protein